MMKQKPYYINSVHISIPFEYKILIFRELKINSEEMNVESLNQYLSKNNIIWRFKNNQQEDFISDTKMYYNSSNCCMKRVNFPDKTNFNFLRRISKFFSIEAIIELSDPYDSRSKIRISIANNEVLLRSQVIGWSEPYKILELNEDKEEEKE